jgi:hypothetical protein
VVLTFNAYACLLPLPTAAGMDCTSSTEEPSRQTCDAFLEIGPLSESPANQVVPAVHFDFVSSKQSPDSIVIVSALPEPPRYAGTPTHHSIRSTVLRI